MQTAPMVAPPHLRALPRQTVAAWAEDRAALAQWERVEAAAQAAHSPVEAALVDSEAQHLTAAPAAVPALLAAREEMLWVPRVVLAALRAAAAPPAGRGRTDLIM